MSAAWFDHRDLNADDSFMDVAHALVICRARYNARVAYMVARAHARGIPVLFDCDDLVFDVGRLHLLVDSLNLDQFSEAVWNDWFASMARIGVSAPLRLFRHDQRVSGRARPGVSTATTYGDCAKLSQSAAAGIVAALLSCKAGLRAGRAMDAYTSATSADRPVTPAISPLLRRQSAGC